MPLKDLMNIGLKSTSSEVSFFCLDFDDMLPIIGAFGKFQIMLFFLMGPFVFSAALQFNSQMLISVLPADYYCYIPELSSLSEEQQMEFIPKHKKQFNPNHKVPYEHCHMYDVNYTHVLEINATVNASWPHIDCKNGWVYNKTELPYETISTEYNWVCGKEEYYEYSLAIFFLGSAIGCILYGYIMDKFGRIPALMLSCFVSVMGGILTAFCQNFTHFVIARFILGSSDDSSVIPIYLIILEFLGPKHRTLVLNAAISFFYTVPSCLAPWIAVLCNNWRIFSLVTSIPSALLLLTYFVLPESPRWLVSVGKIKKALAIIKRAAKINNKTIPEDIMAVFERCCYLYYAEWQSRKQYNISDLFKFSRLRFIYIIFLLVWMNVVLVQDSHIRSINIFHEDMLSILSWANLSQLPVAIILYLILDRIGRRCTTFLSLLLCSFCCFLVFVLKAKWKIAAAYLIGRLLLGVSVFGCMQWAAEILPTELRGQGLSFMQLMRFGGLLFSPLIIYTQKYSNFLPMQIIAVLSLISAMLVLLLPETMHRPLPQTVHDVNELSNHQNFFFSWKRRPSSTFEQAPQ